MQDNLKKAQELNRIIMRKLHDVCHENNIRYFYDAGSLLGAIRHKSFIPWDDDVDVVFMRPEYEKLLALPREVWGEDFELVTSRQLCPGGFLDFVTRLVYLKEDIELQSYDKVKNSCNPKYMNKMEVDCFVLDGAYDSSLRQTISRLRLIFTYGRAMGHRDFVDYSEYLGVKKALIFVLSHIGKHQSLDKIMDKYVKISKSAGNNTNKVFYSNGLITRIHMVFDRSWYRDVVPVQVDDDSFDGPVGYDDILTTIYGDYMTLPPEKERVAIHIVNRE